MFSIVQKLPTITTAKDNRIIQHGDQSLFIVGDRSILRGGSSGLQGRQREFQYQFSLPEFKESLEKIDSRRGDH